MDDLNLLNWLYSDIDELIDFEGYEFLREDENIERTKFNKVSPDNARPIGNDS